MKVTKKMTIAEVVNNHPETSEIFFEYGLHCLGCAMAHFENIEDGCKAHGLDDKKIDEMIKKINKLLEKGDK